MFLTVRSGSLMLKLCLNPVSSVPFVLVRRSLVLRLPIVLLGPCDRTKQETGRIRYFPVQFESHPNNPVESKCSRPSQYMIAAVCRCKHTH